MHIIQTLQKNGCDVILAELCITQFQIAEIFGRVFEKATTFLTAHNAFRATGISIIQVHEYMKLMVLLLQKPIMISS